MDGSKQAKGERWIRQIKACCAVANEESSVQNLSPDDDDDDDHRSQSRCGSVEVGCCDGRRREKEIETKRLFLDVRRER